MSLSSTVSAIAEIHFEGNVIPHIWYQSPLLQHNDGKPNLVAIILLSDIIYWYRPVVLRDESTGRITETRQKFRSDKLHKDYQKWAVQFGLTKRQVQDAVTFLRQNGLITVELRTVEIGGRNIPNIVFLEPVPDAVRGISRLNETPPDPDEKVSHVKTGHTLRPIETPSYVKTGHTTRSSGTYSAVKRETNTKTTAKTSSKITATKASVPEPKSSAPPMPVAVSEENESILQFLIDVGIAKDCASRLLREFGGTRCQRQLDALFHRNAHEPAGTLRRAIEEDWSLPQGLIDAQKAALRRDNAAARKATAQQQQQQQQAAQAAQEAHQRAWKALPASQRARYEQQARKVILAKGGIAERLLDGVVGAEMVRCDAITLFGDERDMRTST